MPPPSPRGIPEPSPGVRYDTFHSQVLVFSLTIFAMMLLVTIWRLVSSLKSVVQHRLKNFTSTDGAIRLPTEDGPPDEIFNEDEELDPADLPPNRRDTPNDIQEPRVSS